MVLYTLNIGTILGIFTRLVFTDAPQIVIGISYLLVGWAILLDPYILVILSDRIPTGTIMAIIGGLSYTLGGLIYTFKYPRLWPRIMGYHELFHIFTIIGTISFTICIFNHAVPYYISNYIV
jgi:hemolysin III